MKEWTEKQVIVKLDKAEEEAVETVLNFLDRMTYLYEEEDVDEIYVEFDDCGSKTSIIDGIPQRAIQALEEIVGRWS